MRISDFPVIDIPFKHVLAPGMECRGKGVLFVIWWPKHGLRVVLQRQDASRENIKYVVEVLKKAAQPF